MGKLTDVAVKAAAPGEKVRRMTDGEAGLYLVVLPDGGKGWRIDYTKPDGRRTTASLGTYPLVSLREARAAAYEMRAAIKKGRDPIAEKRAEQETRKAEHERAAILRAGGVLPGTFEHAAGMYFEKMRGGWSVKYYEQARAKVDKYLLPSLGKRRLDDIEVSEVYAALRVPAEAGRVETAKRTLQHTRAIFEHARDTGAMKGAPPCPSARSLPSKRVESHASITDPARFGQLLADLEAVPAEPQTRAALMLAPLLMLRPGELRQLEWSEVDMSAWLLDIALSKQSTLIDEASRKRHLVPLSRQARAILEGIRPMTGGGRFVFPQTRKKDEPLSEAAFNNRIRAAGYCTQTEHTVHGFRASALTMIKERLGLDGDQAEMQLGHTVKNPLGNAYDRTQWLEERTDMMQRWADYCDALKAGKTPAEAADVALSAPSVAQGLQRRRQVLQTATEAPQSNREASALSDHGRQTTKRLKKGRMGVRLRKSTRSAQENESKASPPLERPPWELIEESQDDAWEHDDTPPWEAFE